MFQLKQVIDAKFPAFYAQPDIITKPTLAILRKLLRETEVNEFLQEARGLEGMEFIDKILEHFNFSYSVVGREIENIPAEGRVVIVANHPLGVLDGVALLKLVKEVRPDARIVANDILMQFPPLRSLLLPVVNLGSGYNKANVGAIREALDRDEAVIIFPSGEVSRAGPLGIRDGRWQAGFLRFAEHAKAPLLPIHLEGRNSALFYSMSTLFKPLSTLLLVGEAMKHRDTTLPIRIGELIPWREIEALDVPREQKIRRITRQLYDLGKRGNKVLAFRTERPVAHPEARLDVRRELLAAESLGRTGDGKDIFLFEGRANSAVMRELGRLREIAFRQVGEGTGRRRDLDAFDAYYRHIVLWDDSELQIVGAYRVGEAREILAARGPEGLYSHGLFELGEGLRPHLAHAIELGRSFVQPRYQGLRALDYLWQGIGAYLASRPHIRYLFGPVSLSAAYPSDARKLLVHFYRRHFTAPGELATARRPFVIDAAQIATLDALIPGADYATEFRTLKQRLSERGLSVPTLYKQYTELCEPSGARFLDFSIDPSFGDCVDGLVLVDLLKIKPSKRERYLGAPRLLAA